ncbi:17894_t:CDS:2 [Dentiscutata erythropus]|uniref:17894_t:CDS:1 n=1 Tax=Dentiscutata erythropus TaxID=1348616 RepID=A0A9N9GL18_9GLOM|nr:17894_t:CDS:2 [Dentiscutata erythropus]
MTKPLILIIILFVNFILVSSENDIHVFNDPEVTHPTDEAVADIFDLMIVIILYFISEKIPLGIAAAILNFMSQLFASALSYYFIIRAYKTTSEYFFIQYLITFSVLTLFIIPNSFIDYWVVLLPSLIFIMFTIIETICALIYENDEVTELKNLEKRVNALENLEKHLYILKSPQET